MVSRWILGILFFGGLAGLALFTTSCANTTRMAHAPPHIEGAAYVGNQVCSECHTNIARMFHGSPHARFQKSNDPKWAELAGCESCHGPGSKHVAVGGGRGRFIINPRKDPATCFECHLEVHAQFKLPQHHPVIENKMNCVQCHDPHGREIFKPAEGLAMARLNQQCAQCHRDQSRVFVFEHEAMREGCVACHTPHGSFNDKMLTERDANLCLKCHAEVQGVPGQVVIGKMDHSAFLRRGTCWTSGCHTAVHGSNINPRMLY